MTNPAQEKKDTIYVDIFKGKSVNFKVPLRWTAQKTFVKNMMTSDEFDDMTGIDEARASVDHSYRIKLQSYVRDLAYSLTGCKKPNGGVGISYLDVIEKCHADDLIETIKDKCIDWCFGTTYIVDKEAKKIEKLSADIDKIDPEALLALLRAKGIEFKEA